MPLLNAYILFLVVKYQTLTKQYIPMKDSTNSTVKKTNCLFHMCCTSNKICSALVFHFPKGCDNSEVTVFYCEWKVYWNWNYISISVLKYKMLSYCARTIFSRFFYFLKHGPHLHSCSMQLSLGPADHFFWTPAFKTLLPCILQIAKLTVLLQARNMHVLLKLTPSQ